MSADDFFSLMDKRPFRPFRILCSDGTTYEVHHPELVVPGDSSVFVGAPPSDRPYDRVWKRFHIVSLNHVVRLEPLPNGPTPKRKRKAEN